MLGDLDAELRAARSSAPRAATRASPSRSCAPPAPGRRALGGRRDEAHRQRCWQPRRPRSGGAGGRRAGAPAGAGAHASPTRWRSLGRAATVVELAALLDDDAGVAGPPRSTRAPPASSTSTSATGRVRFPSTAHAEAAYAALAPRRRLALHRRALARTPPPMPSSIARATWSRSHAPEAAERPRSPASG